MRNPLRLLNKRALGNINVYFRRRHEFHTVNADRYSDVVAETGIQTLLLGGDFTSTATHREFKAGRAFVEGLVERNRDVILMPGNHDYYTFEAVRAKRFDRYFGEWMPEGGLPARMTLPGGTPLVILPTVCANYVSSKGRTRRRDLEKAVALVEDCPPGKVIVTGHYPVINETPWFTTGPSRQLRDADRVRDALGATGREILYVAGHVHRFAYVQDDRHPNMHHLCTNAFFLQRHHDSVAGAFSEIHVEEEGWRVFEHLCDTQVWQRREMLPHRLGEPVQVPAPLTADIEPS